MPDKDQTFKDVKTPVQDNDKNEKYKKRRREYKQKNKEKIKKQSKEYNKRNAERIRKQKQEYYKKNKDRILARQKEYYEKYKEKIQERRKKYEEENKEKVTEQRRRNYLKRDPNKKAEQHRKSRLRPARYDTYADRLSKYHECRRDSLNKDLLQVRCKYCDGWFNPKRQEVIDRLRSINGIQPGEHDLYYSSGCKKACPVYGQRTRYKGQKRKNIISNEIQPQLRKMVFERDSWTCQKCGRNKKENIEIELHCHHIDPIINNPIESADIDNCITLCVDCHSEIHKNIPGCKYNELKCR